MFDGFKLCAAIGMFFIFAVIADLLVEVPSSRWWIASGVVVVGLLVGALVIISKRMTEEIPFSPTLEDDGGNNEEKR